MNFTEAVAEVVRVTQRPDKLQDARREVNAAVNFFSIDGNFKQDIQELLLPVNPAEYTQGILISLLPRFRRMDFIRQAGGFKNLRELDRKDMLTACDLRDRWYLAGSSINISTSRLASNLDVAYYAFPPVLTDAAPTFWMLDGNWPAIVDRAIAKIFSNIGDSQSAQLHEGYARVAYMAFRFDSAQPG